MPKAGPIHWMICLFALAFVASPLNFGTTTHQNTFKSVSEVSVPVFRDGEALPYAVFRAKSIRSDYQRRGFFKIGLLHIVVADDFEIELARPENFLSAMEMLPAILPEIPKKAFTIHNFSVRIRGKNTPLLKADELGPSKDREAFTLLRVGVSGDQRQINSAQLHLKGPDAGEIKSDTGEVFRPFQSTLTSFKR